MGAAADQAATTAPTGALTVVALSRDAGAGARRDVLRDQPGIVAHAVDPVRLPDALEPHADRVEPGDGRDAVALADGARSDADHRDVQPRVGAGEAGRPHDRLDAIGAQIGSVRGHGHMHRCGARRLRSVIEVGERVDAGSNVWSRRSASATRSRRSSAKVRRRAVGGEQPAGQAHTLRLQHVEIEVVGHRRSDELQRRVAAGGVDVSHVDRKLAKNAGTFEPGHDVGAAIAARGRWAWRPTASVTSRPLAWSSAASCTRRRRRADDEDVAVDGSCSGRLYIGWRDLHARRHRRLRCQCLRDVRLHRFARVAIDDRVGDPGARGRGHDFEYARRAA